MNEERLAVLAETPRVWEHATEENQVRGLIQLCREWVKPHFEMVEVGCFAGVSTSVFAEFARTVHAVDPWATRSGYDQIPFRMMLDAEKKFQKVMEQYPNVKQIRDFSVPASRRFSDASIDLVYIDGEHTEKAFREDVEAWVPKLKAGALLAGHDYGQIASYLLEMGYIAKKLYNDTSWIAFIQ